MEAHLPQFCLLYTRRIHSPSIALHGCPPGRVGQSPGRVEWPSAGICQKTMGTGWVWILSLGLTLGSYLILRPQVTHLENEDTATCPTRSHPGSAEVVHSGDLPKDSIWEHSGQHLLGVVTYKNATLTILPRSVILNSLKHSQLHCLQLHILYFFLPAQKAMVLWVTQGF